jgi:outer membrane lipoprotein-sorting protein
MDHQSCENDHVLDQVIEQIRNEDIPPYPRSIATFLARRSEFERQSWTTPSGRNRRTRRLFPVAVAAIAIASAVGSGILFLPAPSWRGAGSAFAEMQQAISSSGSVRFHVIGYVGDDDPTVTTVTMQGPGRFRVDLPGGDVIVEDFEKRERMEISHRNRTALIEPLYLSTTDVTDRANWLRKFQDLPRHAARKLGERILSGRKVIDFTVLVDGEESKVTVDESTKLPIRMEVTRANRAQGKSIREVTTDFVFDASLDDSLFRISPPKGYTVARRARGEPNPEDAAVLVVSPETGIGPAKFGMSIEEVLRALGEPNWRKEHRFPNNAALNPPPEPGAKAARKPEYIMTELGYDARGFRLSTSNRGGLHGIECFNRSAMGPTTRDFQGRTREGIKLGSTKAEVIKAYGEPQARLGSTNFIYAKLGWDFWFRGDALVSIRANQPNPTLEAEVQKDGSLRIRAGK